MSEKLMKIAAGKKCQGFGQKLLLLLLAKFCSENQVCTVTHKELADAGHMSVSSVKVHLAALQDLNLISIVSRGGQGMPNTYRLTF